MVLVGDFRALATAHQAIPVALERAGHECDADVEFRWLHTTTLRGTSRDFLDSAHGVWCVPASLDADTSAAQGGST